VYQQSTSICTQIKGSYTAVANTDYVSAPITDGTCMGVCTQNYKRDLERMLEESMVAGREAVAEPAPVGGKKFIGAVGGQ